MDAHFRLLLIEDDAVDRQAVIRALSKSLKSWEIEQTATASDGLKAAATQRFDAVLLDYRLPDQDGLEVLHRLRSGNFDGLPVIVLTHQEDDALAEQFLEAGAQDFLLKSEVTGRRLVRAVRQAQQRYRIAEDLRKSEEQLRLLIENVTDYAIYRLDPEGKVANWNAGAQKIKGYSSEEIIGQPFGRFFIEQDGDSGEPRRVLDLALRDGSYEGEGWRVRRDGTRFWASLSIKAVNDPAGELQGFVTVTHDITESRDARIALEQAREALFQAQKMEAIGRLAAGVAHDFNNIIQGIVGGLEMVLDDVAQHTRAEKFTKVAINAAMRGSSLTHGLLSYARKQMLIPQTVPLAPFLIDMQGLLTRTLGPNITVKVTAGPTVTVCVDPGQLQTAILNLAINGSHAMQKGGSLTLAAAEERGETSVWTVLRVTDTGTGMDPATLAKAVEPFFTTKGRDGTGLGLSMVQGFAEQSGGRLRITSAPGEGTAVELWLPTARLSAGSALGAFVDQGLGGRATALEPA